MSGVKGHRQLTEGELAVMNGLAELGELVGDFLDNIDPSVEPDPRWLAIARTHLQQGFMAAKRAVGKPDTF